MVVDWGLAKLINSPSEDSDQRKIQVVDVDNLAATQDGNLLGSPAYMSPEQADGQVSLLDARTDIYGLGSILFAILIGNAPHRGTQTGNAARDTISMMRRISEGSTPHVRDLNANLPKALDAICAKATAFRPEDRYQTADAFAADLRAWLAGRPVSVYREGFTRRVWRRLAGTNGGSA